jgi:hypothetical protein
LTSEVIDRELAALYEKGASHGLWHRAGPESEPISRRLTVSTTDTLVARYLQIFNETDETRRRALVDETYTEDCSYTDPLAAVTGRAGVSDFIGAVQKQFPGVVFALNGRVDRHHEQARFTWHAMAQGVLEPVAIGVDVVVLAGDRIRQVYGFLDKAPG